MYASNLRAGLVYVALGSMVSSEKCVASVCFRAGQLVPLAIFCLVLGGVSVLQLACAWCLVWGLGVSASCLVSH